MVNLIFVIIRFRHRLLQELHSQLQSSKYQNKLKIQTLKLHDPPVKANCVAWLGSKYFGQTFDFL